MDLEGITHTLYRTEDIYHGTPPDPILNFLKNRLVPAYWRDPSRAIIVILRFLPLRQTFNHKWVILWLMLTVYRCLRIYIHTYICKFVFMLPFLPFFFFAPLPFFSSLLQKTLPEKSWFIPTRRGKKILSAGRLVFLSLLLSRTPDLF